MSQRKRVDVVIDYGRLALHLNEIPEDWGYDRRQAYTDEAERALAVAHLLEKYINVMSCDLDLLAHTILQTHHTLQQNIWRLVVKMAERMGETEASKDLRNEASHDLARVIRESDKRHLPFI